MYADGGLGQYNFIPRCLVSPCEYIPLGLILQRVQNAIPQTHLVQLDWWTCNIHLQHPFVTSI
jgi:hypothetical protein